MPSHRHIHVSDVRIMLRLGEEVHQARDTRSRRRQLLLGLCRLVNARSGVCVVSRLDHRSRRRTVLSVVSASVPDAQGSDCELAGPDNDQAANDNAIAASGQTIRPVSTGTATCIRSSVAVGESGVASTIRLCCDRERFTVRERQLVKLVHLEMGWIYRGEATPNGHNGAGLSPRQRQTLDLLLAGDSEKQIAQKLRLSQNTVHHYVKALYRHFHVSSRSELLARWVGRE